MFIFICYHIFVFFFFFDLGIISLFRSFYEFLRVREVITPRTKNFKGREDTFLPGLIEIGVFLS